jgi:hypothetical protein
MPRGQKAETVLIPVSLVSCSAHLIQMIAFGISNGPNIRAATEAAIEQKNRTVCSKFGLGTETNGFSECTAILRDVLTSYARYNEH